MKIRPGSFLVAVLAFVLSFDLSAANPEPSSPGPAGQAAVVMEKPKGELDRKIKGTLLERIEMMVGIDAPKEDKLYKNIERARWVALTVKIAFPPGSKALAADDAAALKSAFENPAWPRLLEDPTVRFVVIGFARSSADEVDNVYLSKDRAEYVRNIMRQKIGQVPVVQTLPMGSRSLSDADGAPKEDGVQIWALLL